MRLAIALLLILLLILVWVVQLAAQPRHPSCPGIWVEHESTLSCVCSNRTLSKYNGHIGCPGDVRACRAIATARNLTGSGLREFITGCDFYLREARVPPGQLLILPSFPRKPGEGVHGGEPTVPYIGGAETGGRDPEDYRPQYGPAPDPAERIEPWPPPVPTRYASFHRISSVRS